MPTNLLVLALISDVDLRQGLARLHAPLERHRCSLDPLPMSLSTCLGRNRFRDLLDGAGAVDHVADLGYDEGPLGFLLCGLGHEREMTRVL